MVHWSWVRVSIGASFCATWLVGATVAGCGSAAGQNDPVGGSVPASGSQPTDPQAPEIPRGSGDPTVAFPADLPPTAEMHWLTTIGWGPAQTDRVCARGNQDPVARRLCAEPRIALRSLEDLQRVFWPAGRTFGENYKVGLTYHSQALGARTVSAVNPALILLSLEPYMSGDDVALPQSATDLAIAFTRGDQMVEMLGVDVPNQRLNFYLLVYGHACRAAGDCTASDVLGPRIERDWTSWTLYQAEDIEDTPLSCLSCHQSGGPGTPRRFLMRQFLLPWIHWGESSEAITATRCADGSRLALSQVPTSGATLVPNLGSTFARAHAGETLFGGEPIESLIRRRSGAEISDATKQVRAAILRRDGNPSLSDNVEERFPLQEPFPLDSDQVLQGDYCPGGKKDAWNAYRQSVLLREGFPIPYYGYDILESDQGAPARADYGAYLRANPSNDAFDILSPLVSDEIGTAVGFLPDPDGDAPAILRQMCGRCHTGHEDPGMRRARFDARNPERLTRASMSEAMRRIQLAERDPEVMPPRRAGHLPAWAIERMGAYFAGR
jgi:hypothetical protein